MASKLCDSCKSATATLFCRPDSAFLCLPCDSKIHAANKIASRHPRVSLCDVCEQAPAHVTCKADAASLCVTCDRDIHSANPLARRHDRVPITPFYDASSSTVVKAAAGAAINFLDEHSYFSDADADTDADVSREEAEAASWLLPTPSNAKGPDLNSGQYVFQEIDPIPYVDMEFGSVDPKMEPQERNSSGTADGVVPFVYGYKYSTPSQCVSLSHSVSSSSMEVGVVPDGNTMSEISNCCADAVTVAGDNETVAVAISSADREARVLRYREKRKNRKFEKTIRYASRKAYAETRPRIKGRFAKRSDLDVLAEYGVVPTC